MKAVYIAKQRHSHCAVTVRVTPTEPNDMQWRISAWHHEAKVIHSFLLKDQFMQHSPAI